MTPDQYERWKDFSLRMVPVSIGGNRWRSVVRDIVGQLLAEFGCEHYGIHFSTIKDWDNHEPIPGDDGTCGFAMSHYSPLVCDYVSNDLFERGWEREREYRDGSCEPVDTKVAIAVRCCIRAGLDVAVSPSEGVAGFTAGEIRSMYPEGVPDWVKNFWQPGTVCDLEATNIEGIYTPVNERFDARTFDELPDDEHVWL